MTSLKWNTNVPPMFEIGVDRGVLYVEGSVGGVAWPGLISVAESPVGGQPRAYYIDGVKYLNLSTSEEYTAAIEAYYSPKEFDVCDGSAFINAAVQVRQQSRRAFGFSFRSKTPTGHRIHLIYNALATPTSRVYESMSSDPSAPSLAWSLTTRGIPTAGYSPIANIVIDTNLSNPSVLIDLERILYGTSTTRPRLPSPTEILALYTGIKYAPAYAGLATAGMSWAGWGQIGSHIH